MKGRFLAAFLFFVLISTGNGLFALGKKQVEDERVPQNTEWILCITAFDTSSLSPVWQSAGDTVTRSFAGTLQNMTTRFRGEEETAYHFDYAWAKAKAAAAKKLADKRNERDLLIFRGDSEAKFRKDLKAVDEAIALLEEDLKLIEAPLIEERPVFKLVDVNKRGIFPEPPEPGWENRFCIEQKANAFLSGSLVEYYGRIFLDIRMYTRHSGSYTYEDSVLFSYEDFDRALDEIGSRLVVAVTDIYPSAVLVHASPDNAMVTVDNVYAGQGKSNILRRSPGEAEIAVRADNHVPLFYPIELNPGELSELFISLTPLGRTVFEVEKTETPPSRVYLGSLYVGETPLALELPRNDYSYVSVETPEGEVGAVIYRDNSITKSTTQFVRLGDERGTADFVTSMPLLKEEEGAAKARNSFYKYYGAFWFILPVALLTAGIAGTYIDSNNYVVANNLYTNDPGTRARISDNAGRANLATYASYGAIGIGLGISVFQIFRYVMASGRDATPIVKAEPKGEEQ